MKNGFDQRRSHFSCLTVSLGCLSGLFLSGTAFFDPFLKKISGSFYLMFF